MATVPTFDKMMNPLVQALRNLGGRASIEEIASEVAALMRLSDEQLGVLHNPERSSQTEFEYRLAWTRTYLGKAGILENVARGVWALTKKGQEVERLDPVAIKRMVRDMDRETRAETLPLSASPQSETEQESATVDGVERRSLTPGLPEYVTARHFLHVMDGIPYALYRSTYNEIWSHRGSPQDQVDWSEPEEWIPRRLQGDEAALALRAWRESGGALNPRYFRGSWYLTTKHELLEEEDSGTLRMTERGQRFLENPNGQVVAGIDQYEGLLTVLRLVADRGPGRRSDFLPEYAEFCRAYTGYQSDTPIRGSLYDRLTNLIARDYVGRSGQVYEITEAGLAYLEQYAHLVPGRPTPKTRDRQADLRRLAREIRQEAREQMESYLIRMDPFKFEELIKFLLEEMGYRDVETTSPVNDKGVDVVADIDLGISSVREVVQVKRLRSNVGRRVLDQLRGSLYRFNAVRGTIITTGGFTRGTQEAAFERGAAPITLINGEKLLDLLIEHEIGVSKQAVEYLQFDAAKLEQFEGVNEAI